MIRLQRVVDVQSLPCDVVRGLIRSELERGVNTEMQDSLASEYIVFKGLELREERLVDRGISSNVTEKFY